MPPNQPIKEVQTGEPFLSKNFYKVENLAQLFQVILGFSTVFYITGYLSWAIYASENNFGILPAIREQYFMAGIVPALLFIFLLVIAFGHTRFSLKLLFFFKSHKRLSQLAKLLSFIMYFIALWIIFSGVFHAIIQAWVGILAIALLYISSYLLLLLSPNSDFSRGVPRWLWVFISIWVWIVFLYTYAAFVFPIMPHEFGGAKPIRAELDIKRGDLSTATVQVLCPDSFVNNFEYSFFMHIDTPVEKHMQEIFEMPYTISNTAQSQIFRTRPLYLIFEADDFILLETRNDRPVCKTNPLFKLKKSVINDIISISEDDFYNQEIDSKMLALKKIADKYKIDLHVLDSLHHVLDSLQKGKPGH